MVVKKEIFYIFQTYAALFIKLQYKTENEIFNLGSGRPQSIMRLAKMIFNKFIFLPWRPGEPKKTHANINKIQKKLNWKPKIGLKIGIEIVLKNINWWKNAPLWTPSKIKKATKNWHKYLG